VRLGVLPASQKWRQVIEQLRLGADADLIAAAVANAAEGSLKRASYDPAFLHSFWLLTQIPLAARSSAFAEELRRLRVPVPDRPGVMDLSAGISEAVDQHAREHGGRTDLGEMAQMAAVESLTAVVGANLPSLFRPTPEEVQRAVGRFASGSAFSVLAREYFVRLTQRTLGYFLSRELANHIGPGRRFESDAERAGFDNALDWHCREASRIVEAFAGGWYGKHVYQGEGLTPDVVKHFTPVAFRKIVAELRKRRDAEG
jgi:hypothetical protein